VSLKKELEEQVRTIFRARWTESDGYVVPEDDSLKLDNDGIKLDATVLYADMSDSTKLVEQETKNFAAEIYKTFLHCAAKIIKDEGGTVTAYDGDRVMAVYLGDYKNTSAVRSALKIYWAALNIITPAMKAEYKTTNFKLKHVVGIDTSKIFVARTGVRGANDLVWVGRAANHAAKLTTLSHAYPTYITGDVYSKLHSSAKMSNGVSMWKAMTWNTLNNSVIYGSTYSWRIN
jgi:class 3 adenylate cyclase